MAISGLGAVSFVAPLVLASCIRAIAYRRLLSRNLQHPVRADEFDQAPVGRGFALMAAAQYVHILVNVVDWPIVWLFRSVSDAGAYYFAWNLSIQANSVISAQFAQTLQPVLVLLRFDPARQVQGFLRSLRVLASIAAPLALLQAAIARPAFHLLFGERWDTAIGGFVALSIGQSFAFSVGPVLALLKADGRTALLLKLQSAQLIFSVCALCIGGWLTQNMSDQGSAIFVIAIASALQFLVFCPLSVWATLRGRGGEPAAAVLLFLRPLAAAIGPSALAFYGAERLDELGSAGRLAACLVLPVGYLALYAIMLYAIDRRGASEVMTVVRATAGRLRQLTPRSR
jgi:O-antigen/teichoic acid export membrane protein